VDTRRLQVSMPTADPDALPLSARVLRSGIVSAG
jgi:hypothetical protein